MPNYKIVVCCDGSRYGYCFHISSVLLYSLKVFS